MEPMFWIVYLFNFDLLIASLPGGLIVCFWLFISMGCLQSYLESEFELSTMT
jgi:hypothetical protein